MELTESLFVAIDGILSREQNNVLAEEIGIKRGCSLKRL